MKRQDNIIFLLLKFLHTSFDFFLFLTILFCIYQQPGVDAYHSFLWSCCAIVCFALPYVIFASFNGTLVDRFSSVYGLRVSSGALVFFALIAGGFFNHFLFLFVLAFFLGANRSLYTTSNYAYLSANFRHEKKGKLITISHGISFLVILFSILCLGGRQNIFKSHEFLTPILFFISIPALAFSFLLKKEEKQEDVVVTYSPLYSFKNFQKLKRHSGIATSIYALSAFWSLISIFCLTMLSQINDKTTIASLSYLITLFFLGGIISAIATSRLFKGRVELGVIPLGAVIASASIFCCSFFSPKGIWFYLLSFLVGFGLSFFILPTLAYLQNKITPKHSGRYNATVLMMMILLSLLVVGAYAVIFSFKFSNTAILRSISVIGIILTICVCVALPKLFLRCVVWVFVNTIYKLKVIGLENIPRKGGAIIVCNHLSYLDPFIIMALVTRSVRFLIYDSIYNLKYVKPIAKILRAIPIPDKCSRDSLKALEKARQAVRKGEIVVVFAEGQVARVGNMLPFTAGFTRIAKGTNAPVIPMCLDRIWGTSYMLRDGKFTRSMPKELPYPLTILVGTPIKDEDKEDAYKVRRVVQELEADSTKYRKEVFQLLHISFMRTAKKRPFSKVLFDSAGPSAKGLRNVTILGMSLLISRKLKGKVGNSKFVGVMIPPSCGGALTNIALHFLGKIPINLNYTAGNDFLISVEKQTGMEKIITAKKVLEKLNMEKLDSMMFLEEELKGIKTSTKLFYILIALLMPKFLIEKIFLSKRPSRHDMATIIFSSGSTGDPKGVMLSHNNITSEMECVLSTVHFGLTDGLVGILPFFHSFGYTVALWLPLLRGVKVCYHSNPLDGTVVGQMIEKHKLTFLVATGMFMANYIRKCSPEQFKTLRFAITGAEKLQKQIADNFQEKFKLQIYEGYGCTELSPVACVNLYDTEGYWKTQKGVKFGTVGRPLKGVCAKIVSLETDEELGPNQEGMLYIKGPNVMMGYYGKPELTKEVLKDGWYVTGDIATCDNDGFIKIVDRVSRFSKIAGEMVPHIKAEEEIQDILGREERCCVVTGVPDGKKGEKLVVLYTVDDLDPKEISKKLQERGLANLWIPKPDDYYKVDAFPVLGAGKLDLRGVKKLALEVTGATKEN